MNLFLLLGNDDWEKEEFLKTEVSKWLDNPTDDSLQKQIFYGSEFNADLLAQAYESISLFAEKKALIIRNGEKLTLNQLNQLAETVKIPQEDTGVFFLGEKVDGRSKFKKLIKKQGKESSFKLPYPDQMPAWLSKRCQIKFGRKLALPDAKYLCDCVSENISEIEMELQKLDTYLPPNEPITAQKIEELIVPHRESNIWDLQYQMGMRNKGEAIISLKKVLEDNTPPFLVAMQLFKHALQLLKINVFSQKGFSKQQIVQSLNIHPFIYDKKNFLPQAKSRSLKLWKKNLIKLSQLEYDFKRGKYSESFEVEMAFASIF